MRRMLVLPCAAWMAACYSPHASVTSSEGDESSGGSGSTGGMTATSAATTTTADSSGDAPEGTGTTTADPTGDTDADAPPVIENFEVQGSQMPAEILMADTVVLSADVTDDIGVARVEFYDDGELVATVDGAPWRTEFLVTSADNGGHEYTAIAYDTSDQTAEAGPIPLSVTIDGGATIELREDVFHTFVTLGINGPYLLPVDDEVVVVGPMLFEGNGFSTYRVRAKRYSLGLSEIWSADFPLNPNAATVPFAPFGRGGVEEGNTILVPGSPNTSSPTKILRGAANNGAFSTALNLGEASANTVGGIAVTSAFDVAMVTSESTVAYYAADLETLAWERDVMGGLGAAGIYRLHACPDGGIVLDIIDGTTQDASIRKISAEGDILWTRTSDEQISMSDYGSGFSAVALNGDVAHVVRRGVDSSLGLRVVTYDNDGTLLFDSVVDTGSDLSPSDVAFDASGALVIAAREEVGDQLYDAWVGRLTAEGNPIWIRRMEIDPDDEIAYGVLTRPDGRLFVTGIDAVAPDWFVVEGDVWIAELMP